MLCNLYFVVFSEVELYLFQAAFLIDQSLVILWRLLLLWLLSAVFDGLEKLLRPVAEALDFDIPDFIPFVLVCLLNPCMT